MKQPQSHSNHPRDRPGPGPVEEQPQADGGPSPGKPWTLSAAMLLAAAIFAIDLSLPLEPARVKWFDKAKGFGFANVFGRDEDVFLHIEVLRRSGLADLQPGEAVSLRVVDGKRGRMAMQVTSWESALRQDE